jgi:septal ring factor EnvC (AmiA/AmiB activator)
MVKNIMAGAICLFCVNMLFNKAAVIRLEREVKEQEQISIELQTKIDGTKTTIDSLEAVLKQLEYERN